VSLVPDPSTKERLAALLTHLDNDKLILGNEWLESVEDRKREEAVFHDRDREGRRDELGESSRANRRFYVAARRPDLALEQWRRRAAAGALFLDYACGHGNQAIQAAKEGALLSVGIDISETSVRNAQETAIAAGVGSRTRFLQRDCEATGFPDGTFDVILCSGMLHHLDLNHAYPELFRILRPGGRIFCYEALSINPVIQWYRDRTPELRTAWEKEHILGLKDVRMAKRWFRVENMQFFNLVSPLAGLLPRALRSSALPVLDLVDTVLTRIPGLRLLSWMFAFELVKPATSRPHSIAVADARDGLG
jgi:ubiquinone/menaquinone biosynthesis C-methylase UbiE